MDIKEFFWKANVVCRNSRKCIDCPITNYCVDGIFANDSEEFDSVIEMVERVFDEINLIYED